jgi:hypothetical protein
MANADIPTPEHSFKMSLQLLLAVVAAFSPGRNLRARAQARLPIFGGIVAACQTGPIRRGLLARRFLLRGAVNNQRSTYA